MNTKLLAILFCALLKATEKTGRSEIDKLLAMLDEITSEFGSELAAQGNAYTEKADDALDLDDTINDGWLLEDAEDEKEGEVDANFEKYLKSLSETIDEGEEVFMPIDPNDYANILPSHITRKLFTADRMGTDVNYLKPHLDKYAELSGQLRSLEKMKLTAKSVLASHRVLLSTYNEQRIRRFEEWEKREKLPKLKILTGTETNAEFAEYDRDLEKLREAERTKVASLYEPASKHIRQTEEELDITDKQKAKIKILKAFETSLIQVLDQMSDAIDEALSGVGSAGHWAEKTYSVQPPTVSRSVMARFLPDFSGVHYAEIIQDTNGPENSEHRTEGSVVLSWSDALTGSAQYTQSKIRHFEGIAFASVPAFKITVPSMDPEALQLEGLPVRKIKTVNEIIFKQLLLACLFKHKIILVDMIPFYELGLPSSVVEKLYGDWAAKLSTLDFDDHQFERIILCNDMSGEGD